jgi:predicted MPP superfamily phosphohydrolase
MITRRLLLKGIAATFAGTIGLVGYASGVEAGMELRVTRYRIALSRWPTGFRLKLAILADLHTCEPWMPAARIRHIAETATALRPDAILLLGDYAASGRFVAEQVPAEDWSEALAVMQAPLGVHAIVGNHDWWQDLAAQQRGSGPLFGALALEKCGIPVHQNRALRLVKDGQAFWLLGLDDQLALLPGRRWGRKHFQGMDDLQGALSQVTDESPIILMAHEPDIFPRVPQDVALTLSGHTHGGQIRILGYSPVVPSRFGNRSAYGHVTERADPTDSATERHLVVSGGLGCSIIPARFGVPPEIVQIEISRA